MNRASIFVLLGLFLFSCSQEEAGLFDPTYFADGIKGITFTDNSSNIIKEDKSDWCYESKLNKKTEFVPGQTPITFEFRPAYPNPTEFGKSIVFTFALPSQTHVYMYVVDSNYKMIHLLVNSKINAGNHQFTFNSEGLQTPGVYRAIIETESNYCSGDIWIK